MDIVYKENALTAEDVLLFQQKMNWTIDPQSQWEAALQNTLYSVTAHYNDELIAMGRLLGDGAIYWYLNDIFVLAKHQGQGIGRQIVTRLIEYVRKSSLQGTEVSVYLMCAQGKEGFYKKFGFKCRPHKNEGAGMELDLRID